MYGSQQNQKIDKNKYEKNIKEILLCNFLLGTLQYFKKRHPFFFATKKKKKHPQKLFKNIHFFHPELPKWPKKKDSSSKLWLIEQHLNVLPSNWPKSAFCRTSNLSPMAKGRLSLFHYFIEMRIDVNESICCTTKLK